jgi:hypothetical protein
MFGTPIPVLRSFDEARTKAFYLDFLGFVAMFEHRHEPGLPLYLGVRSGACVLHLTEHYGDGSPGAAVRVPCEDATAYAAALREKSTSFARPGAPRPTPWGTLEFTLTNPSANRLTFYSPDPGQENA